MTTSKKSMATKAKDGAYLVLSWVAVLLWAGVIFYMSSRTSSGLSTGFFGMVGNFVNDLLNGVFGTQGDPISVICHFLEYTMLGALLMNALGCRVTLGKAALLAIAIASLYGVSDEVHQIFVDGRVCDPADWLTDTLGATLGSILMLINLKRR